MSDAQSAHKPSMPRNQFVSALLTDYYQITMVRQLSWYRLPLFHVSVLLVHHLPFVLSL